MPKINKLNIKIFFLDLQKFAFHKKITLQNSTTISLHARFTPSWQALPNNVMRQKSKMVSGSKQAPNGNCLSKNLEEAEDCTSQNFVDLGEIKKENNDNLDPEYPVGEDPINIRGMRKKRKITQQKNLNHGPFQTNSSFIQEGNKSIKCTFCETSFNQMKSMKLHISSVHEGKKPFKCSTCDYKTSTKQHLSLHISSVHEGKKPFKCSTCDYKCSQKGSLTGHIAAVHGGKKLFKC